MLGLNPLVCRVPNTQGYIDASQGIKNAQSVMGDPPLEAETICPVEMLIGVDPLIQTENISLLKSQYDCLQKLALDNRMPLKEILNGVSVKNGHIIEINLFGPPHCADRIPCSKSINISALQDLTNLKKLVLSRYNITDVNPLQDLTNLEVLVLGGNKIIKLQLRDISALRGLTSLKEFDLVSSEVSDISALQSLTNLERLRLVDNKISGVGPLQGLTSLKELDLFHNKNLRDISALQSLTNLEILGLQHSPVDRAQVQELRTVFPCLEINI